MFKKKVVAKVSSTNIVSVKGYVPNPSECKLYVAQCDNLAILKDSVSFKKDCFINTLIATATLTAKSDVAHGNKIILVSKKFMKLPKKEKLALIAYENDLVFGEGLLENLTRNVEDEIRSTNSDRVANATLMAMTAVGVKPARKALKKKSSYLTKSCGKIGKQLYKVAKKAATVTDEVSEEEILEDPATFAAAEPMPI